MATKQTTFLRDIAFNHHPGFMNKSVAFQRQILVCANAYPKSFDVENIVEIALANVGGYNFIDTKAQDFDDQNNSDSKTGSVNLLSRRVEITSIENKVGALRVTIWNPILDVVDYMFLPYDEWNKVANSCYGKNKTGKLRLQMTWDRHNNNYNSFEKYRLKSFTELATMTEDKFYTQYLGRPVENTLELLFGSVGAPKIVPTQQTPTLCIATLDQQQTLNFEGTPPTSLSEIS